MKKTALILSTLIISLWFAKAEGQVHDSILSADYFNGGKQLWISQPNTWLIYTGPDTSLASANQSDEKWLPEDIRFIGEGQPAYWEGSGWFKTMLKVDSSMYGKEIALFGFTRGAAEIYLNSVLVGTIGVIGNSAESEVALGYIKPFTFRLGSDNQQELSIRFSNYEMKSLWLQDFCGIDLFMGNSDIAFKYYDNKISEMNKESSRFNFILGFMVALAMFHFLLFFYYPAERANLTCALLFSAIAGLFLSGVLFDMGLSVKETFRYAFGESLSLVAAGIILPFFIFQILKRKFNWLPFTFLAIGLVLLALLFINPVSSRAINFLFFLISMILGVALVIHARFKLKKTELNIVLLFYMLALILLLPGFIEVSLGIEFLWGKEPFYMNLTAPVGAAGYSFFLARNVPVTNRRLKKELLENERLTAEKLQAEHDKQILIEKQKERLEKEVAERTLELRNSLTSLKATQNLLIQQEKLASLGELTAGIAHEIQNPLNFVNNFSEVSNELIDEMNFEMDNGELAEAKLIAADIKQNLQKINHHGKRADSIVKGMLEHSRASSAEKEPTEINALADEYLRLAYHGLRAKDKSFNANLKTDFDNSIGKIEVIPQDIGRVLLNLFNNAFYVVDEKKKGLGDDTYDPTVSVSTKKAENHIEIRVTDNGNGIPQKILDKIYQPFFTTKPTGQGTGLGLSLSYDIVNAHGGELSVKTKENEGTTFTIILPHKPNEP